jgi:hypothetical protein
MIKSVTFISMAVTTFVLVLLAGVVYAYQGFAVSAPTPTLQATFNPQTVDSWFGHFCGWFRKIMS